MSWDCKEIISFCNIPTLQWLLNYNDYQAKWLETHRISISTCKVCDGLWPRRKVFAWTNVLNVVITICYRLLFNTLTVDIPVSYISTDSILKISDKIGISVGICPGETWPSLKCPSAVGRFGELFSSVDVCPLIVSPGPTPFENRFIETPRGGGCGVFDWAQGPSRLDLQRSNYWPYIASCNDLLALYLPTT